MVDANIKTPQDALEWLDRSIREEVELDDEMSNAHAIQLGFIQKMLAKFPRRNCDVGTVKEQDARFRKFCKKDSMDNFEATAYCAYECPCGNSYDCKLAWAQMPYEEGGAK